MKKILVTGGAGFLGSHLIERLLARGDEVICVDNFSTSDGSNIEKLKDYGRFRLVKHDIVNYRAFDVNEIYNLACPASPQNYQKDPIHTMRTSVWGAYNLLELAKVTGAKILQASTSEIYGDPHQHPQSETYWGNVNTVGIRSCYDEGKRAAETLFMDYYRCYGVKVKIVRIFNTYGPGLSPSDGRVVSNFMIQALQGNDITIYGDGSQTRSFCYVSDLIEGFIRMMDTPDNLTGPINLGNPNEFTIKELAEKVIQVTNSNSKIVYRPLPMDDPKQRRPDITNAKEILGWQPQIQLKEGLVKVYDHFRLDPQIMLDYSL